ncbi:hypothetical protein SARC_16184 [Sphaeroforma arctica JP610]|uniref:Uncharacterized protein n=1 Tax=Sphaeroforma arctica JP610 TaxID=667725 RepID=A0A0L0F3U9_9EUKA|nr:hypothetical protein SARC_16184 [Sphaeroforma arctica JP610]KNC71279.1 hypothetical protein SARC_16184 [Sphaeroforma arctica JP610]|eukprot:XP_014145181.1 hypothetical protein SARC_16184 [Sphaeroforma arctica JP610]
MDSKRSKKGSCPNWDTREFVCIKTQPTSYKASERERRASLMSEDLSLPQTVALHEATASYHAVLARMKASIPPVLFNGALGVVVGKVRSKTE